MHRLGMTVLAFVISCFSQLAMASDLELVADIHSDEAFSALQGVDTVVQGQRMSMMMEQLDPESTEYDVTAVLLGGWNSCSEDPTDTQVFHAGMAYVRQKMAEGKRVRIVATCFKLDPQYIYVYFSSQPGQVYWGYAHDIVKVVHWEAAKVRNKLTYIVGHSYGGWLALYISMALMNDIKIAGLTTLDPISRRHCTPTLLLSRYLLGLTVAGCTRAPVEFGQEKFRQLQKSVGWWYNIYQVNTFFLHAGALPYARNHVLPYDLVNPLNLFTAHMKIDNDERSWQIFADQYLAVD